MMMKKSTRIGPITWLALVLISQHPFAIAWRTYDSAFSSEWAFYVSFFLGISGAAWLILTTTKRYASLMKK